MRRADIGVVARQQVYEYTTQSAYGGAPPVS
jgi:hypothetical protein